MRKKIALVALAGGLSLSAGALAVPGVASAAGIAGTVTSAGGGRLAALRDALAGLVTDGTLTGAQADKVAATLDRNLPRPPRFRGPGGPDGPGGEGRPGHLHPDEVAKVIGITPSQLRTQLEAGKTLAAIGLAHGVSTPALIDRLVLAAQADLARDVQEGRLTQAEADMIKTTLRTRITRRVNRIGFGPRGARPQGPPPHEDGATGTPSGFTGSSA